MKTKLNLFCVILLAGLLSVPLLASAQTFDINSPVTQQATITSPGFFPFSSISNDAFKEGFAEDMTLDISFSNFLGGPCTIAPAADFAEIGSPFTVTGSSDFILDFSMASSNASTFGLSLVPKGSPCTFNLFITTPNISSSSGSISTSSGGIVSTNEELISNAIFLETMVKNNLSLDSTSFEDDINDIEMSLSLLNELSTSFSNNSTSESTSLIQKKITCAIEADNQVKTILQGLNGSHESTLKAKKLLRKALRCKKTIQKKL